MCRLKRAAFHISPKRQPDGRSCLRVAAVSVLHSDSDRAYGDLRNLCAKQWSACRRKQKRPECIAAASGEEENLVIERERMGGIQTLLAAFSVGGSPGWLQGKSTCLDRKQWPEGRWGGTDGKRRKAGVCDRTRKRIPYDLTVQPSGAGCAAGREYIGKRHAEQRRRTLLSM